MWSLLRKSKDECSCLRDALERNAAAAALPPAQQRHLAACPDCQNAADELYMSRILLRDVPSRAATPGPWFAPRVMAAIAARESELRQTRDAWALVPKLAARLTWVSALALLLASTWLYEAPKTANTQAGSEGAIESLFDTGQPPAQDDVLLMEKGQ